MNGSFSAAGSLAVGRSSHTASVLPDGSVLVVGGYNDNEATACPNSFCQTAERWVNGSFSAAGSLAVGRSEHTASVLPDGSVLVVGGSNTNDATACPNGQCQTAERWVNGVFSAAGSLTVGRFGHTASVLPDGSVLVVGGYNNNDATACPNNTCKTAERWEPDASDLGTGGAGQGGTGGTGASGNETCSGPTDCAQGYTCQNATCVLDSGSGGQGGTAGSGATGGSGGASAGGGGAPAAAAPAAEEGGCGCALPGHSQPARGVWLGVALGLATFRRRRRAA